MKSMKEFSSSELHSSNTSRIEIIEIITNELLIKAITMIEEKP